VLTVPRPIGDRGRPSAIVVLSLKSLPAHEFAWPSIVRRAIRRVSALQEIHICSGDPEWVSSSSRQITEATTHSEVPLGQHDAKFIT
jgi:hypothetical protein